VVERRSGGGLDRRSRQRKSKKKVMREGRRVEGDKNGMDEECENGK
jgi:hypothetical protein